MEEILRETSAEEIEIPPEADSYSIDGWDMNNSQQQAYIRAINRHLTETVDTDTKETESAEKGDEEEERRENHGIIGCGIYYPWVTKEDEWAKALQKAEAATGYRASWHWNMDEGEVDEIADWETGEKKTKEQKTEKAKKELEKTEGWYDKIEKPYEKAYIARTPEVPKEGWRKSPKRKQWEAERQRRFKETLKQHQKMFAELLSKK